MTKLPKYLKNGSFSPRYIAADAREYIEENVALIALQNLTDEWNGHPFLNGGDPQCRFRMMKVFWSASATDYRIGTVRSVQAGLKRLADRGRIYRYRQGRYFVFALAFEYRTPEFLRAMKRKEPLRFPRD